MDRELEALTQNQTWELTDLPPGKKPIGCKWVHKIKLNPDGSIQRYKARLVVKVYNQQFKIDYTKVFSPVAKMVTARFLLAIVVASNWPIHQLDFNSAFFHCFLKYDIYMFLPHGFKKPDPNQVCMLVEFVWAQAGFKRVEC